MRNLFFLISVLLVIPLSISCTQNWDVNTKPVLVELRLVKDNSPELIDTSDLMPKSLLNNSHIDDAYINRKNGKIQLGLSMNAKGTLILYKITNENLNKRIAFVIDGKVEIAPIVYEAISGGQLAISSDMTKERANEIVAGILKYNYINNKENP